MNEMGKKDAAAQRKLDWDEARAWWADLAGVTRDRDSGVDDPALEEAREERRETRSRRGNPGALARLRRAATPVEAVLDPEACELVRRIGGKSSKRRLRVAMLATLLAHVREDDAGRSVASALGGPDEDDRIMKSARFRRLMLTDSDDELLVALRRALAMLGRKADVRDLARAWLLWNHPSRGDQIRIDWTFAYVGSMEKTTTTPSANGTSAEEITDETAEKSNS